MRLEEGLLESPVRCRIDPRRPPPLFPPSRPLLEPRSLDEDVWLNFVMAGGATKKRLVLALKKISVMHVIKLGFAPVSFPPG